MQEASQCRGGAVRMSLGAGRRERRAALQQHRRVVGRARAAAPEGEGAVQRRGASRVGCVERERRARGAAEYPCEAARRRPLGRSVEHALSRRVHRRHRAAALEQQRHHARRARLRRVRLGAPRLGKHRVESLHRQRQRRLALAVAHRVDVHLEYTVLQRGCAAGRVSSLLLHIVLQAWVFVPVQPAHLRAVQLARQRVEQRLHHLRVERRVLRLHVRREVESALALLRRLVVGRVDLVGPCAFPEQ